MIIDLFTHQALITGSVRDAITRARPRQPVALQVVRDDDGRAVGGVTPRIGTDGLFVVFGDPGSVLAPQDITLRVEFRAAGYQPLDRQVAFSAADLARTPQLVSVAGTSATTNVISGAPKVLDVAMLPAPITIKGRVARADDAGVPIAGAQVQITAPAVLGPVTTNVEGYFTLGPAPVAQTLTLSITAAGFDALTREIRSDFRQPVNTGAFALEQS